MGDTVNTASRMESHGVVSHAQLSDTTWQELQKNFHHHGYRSIAKKEKQIFEEYTFSAQDEVAIKGKGMLKTWLAKPTSRNDKRKLDLKSAKDKELDLSAEDEDC